MSFKGWAEKKVALFAINKIIASIKEGGPMSPQIKEYIEGAFAFIAPAVLVGITDAMGAGNKLDWKVLLVLSLTSLGTYVRTRPTQH